MQLITNQDRVNGMLCNIHYNFLPGTFFHQPARSNSIEIEVVENLFLREDSTATGKIIEYSGMTHI